ncbi:peptidase M16 [Thalassotalea sp. M1531]|uniref:Protease 3 n=1 Tax=Thalassotalea algicola TaxID=2716224 RepID=A0A7Y0LEK0_9GAMM|nr:insulinase family protein [Thalassotalea algicola]NMP32996.1 peptidase M16 [Thalassotalea algicola]
MKQSPNDKKHYLPITLDNGLKVLLIQNKESDKAAAALAVNAGHFDDPKDRQGLAHFVEHMLFLGTKNYPDGSEYQKFISQHGGHNNAWTGTEHTCYFFDIHSSYLEPALARFADFFISPLLSEQFVESERQNIDAEFKLKLKDDIRRLYDVHKETVNQAHPFAQFSVGNIETLADRPGQPAQQDIEQFFKQYYKAELMTLAIEGPQDVQDLRKLAHQYFDSIASGGKKVAVTTPLYLTENLAMEISVQPVKNDKQLIVSFALPCIDKYYRHKPESILTYLLGHEGKGSILSYLKNKQWAFGLTAGSGINGSNFKDFNISISLTEAGELHTEEILDTIFSYIQLLKKAPIPHHFYFEKQELADTAFQFLEKLKPMDSVSQLVVNMQHYPIDDYIFGDYVMEGMCDKSITELLAFINPENCRVIKIGQQYRCDKVSHWYQVPYAINNIKQKTLEKWAKIDIYEQLFLPDENPYIVEKPKVWPHSYESNKPALIETQNGLCIWYKQDTTFKVPKGYIYLGIDSPLAVSSTANIAMTRLFADLFTDKVIEEHYDAELAGIHYHLYAHQGGITLQVSGLSEKQPLLLGKLLSSLTNHSFNEEQFNLLKNQQLKQWENADKNKSISQLFSTLSAFMQPHNPSSEQLKEALAPISFDAFNHFCHQLFEHVTLDVLIHGNWLENHAHDIAELIKDAFDHNFDGRNHVSCPIIDISEQKEIIIPVEMLDHDHAAVCYYPLTEKDNDSTALTMLTSHLLAPIFFQEMRTEKQYGYLVNVGYIPINRYPGIAFYIQSPNTLPCQLIEAMDEFVEQADKKISTISEQQWLTFKHGLAAQLKEKDTSLRTKSQRFWAAICNKDFEFNRKQLLIESIEKVTLADISSFLNELIRCDEHHHYIERVTLVSSDNINDLTHWQSRVAEIVLMPQEFTQNSKRKY